MENTMTTQEIKELEKEIADFKANLPQAPKSAKWGTGTYYTESDGKAIMITKNEMTGMWTLVDDESDEYMDTFFTKREALESLIK